MSKKQKSQLVPTSGLDKVVSPLSAAILIVSINIYCWQLIRTDQSELWDKIIYATSLVLSFILILVGRKIAKSLFVLVPGSVSLLIGIMGVEKHGTETTSGVDVTGILWLGFGPIVFAVSLIVIPFCFELLDWNTTSPTVKNLLRFVSFAVTLFSLLSCWQTGSSIIDMYSSEYVLNEGLALPAGNFPYVNFIPQYGTLFSIITFPFRHLLKPDALVTFILIQHFIISIISIFIGVLIVRKTFNKTSWVIPILLVVSFTCLTHLPNRKGFAGSIFDLIQELPIRLFFGMVIGLLTIELLRIDNIRKRYLLGLCAGTCSGLGIWINQDFIFLASLIGIGFIFIFSKNIKVIFTTIFGYLLGFGSYPIWVLLHGKSVNFKFFGFFVVQYSGGFMAEAIKTPGPVLIILPIITGLAMISLVRVFEFNFVRRQVDEVDRFAWYSVLYFSSWCVGGFLYYLNRSYASGQMQTLFLPLSVAFGSYLSIFYRSPQFYVAWNRKNFFSLNYWKRETTSKGVLIPLAIILSLFFATSIAAPSPHIELKRIKNAPNANKWPAPTARLALENFNKIKLTNPFPHKKMAYFGASGNYIQLATDIPSANILNSPWDIPVTQNTINTGCKELENINADVLLLGPEALSLFRFKNNTLCERYQLKHVEGFKDGTFAIKIV